MGYNVEPLAIAEAYTYMMEFHTRHIHIYIHIYPNNGYAKGLYG